MQYDHSGPDQPVASSPGAQPWTGGGGGSACSCGSREGSALDWTPGGSRQGFISPPKSRGAADFPLHCQSERLAGICKHAVPRKQNKTFRIRTRKMGSRKYTEKSQNVLWEKIRPSFKSGGQFFSFLFLSPWFFALL